MIRTLLPLALATLLVAPRATAEPVYEVMGAHTGNPDVLIPIMDIGDGVQFDVVVLLHSPDNPSSFMEFVMTELLRIAPGVFKLQTQLINDIPIPLDLSGVSIGEYVFGFGACEPAGRDIELVRITYGTFGGPVPPDTVIELRGFQPGDTQYSSFDGHPGIKDCEGGLLPGVMGGHEGGYSDTGVVFPDGSLALNMTMPVVPAEAGSWGALKARY